MIEKCVLKRIQKEKDADETQDNKENVRSVNISSRRYLDQIKWNGESFKLTKMRKGAKLVGRAYSQEKFIRITSS